MYLTCSVSTCVSDLQSYNSQRSFNWIFTVHIILLCITAQTLDVRAMLKILILVK